MGHELRHNDGTKGWLARGNSLTIGNQGQEVSTGWKAFISAAYIGPRECARYIFLGRGKAASLCSGFSSSCERMKYSCTADKNPQQREWGGGSELRTSIATAVANEP